MAAAFEPAKHLTKVGGGDYLEVKWRLVWFRETHPDAIIETELITHEGTEALFRARVSVPGGGSATGWGSEGASDFRDYIEKAETKALGRALAALGFGTQFCPDYDFGAAAGRVVDSPIDFNAIRGRLRGNSEGGGDDRPAATSQPATQRQLRYLLAIAREAGLSDAQLDEEAQSLYALPVSQIDRRDASALIERLQTRRAEQSQDIAS